LPPSRTSAPRQSGLTEFASDVAGLADERRDLELRELVDELHFDLMRLEGDDDE
jgi:hypothetical protein